MPARLAEIPEDPASRRMYLALSLFLIGMVAVVGMQWWLTMHGGVDENGYLVAGRTLADHGTLTLKPPYGPDGEVPTFVGDMWVGVDLGTPAERYYTKYPPGVPALMALALLVGRASWGPTLCYLLNPIGYCAALLASYFLVRRLTTSLAAIGALICIACSGPIVRLFTIPGSHGISFAVLAWAMYLLVRWIRDGGIGFALGAGLLTGFGGICRSGELVLLAPLLLAAILRWTERRSRQSLLESATLLVAWTVPVAIAAAVQYRELGTWSAYSATGEQSAFSLAYFREHVGTMLSSMTWRGVFLAFPAGLIGLVLLFRYHWRLAAVLLCWVLVNLILYTSYYWAPLSDYNVYARFFLPSYPALLVGAMGLFVWPAGRTRMLPVFAGMAVVVGVLCGSLTLLNNWVWANIEVIGRNNLEKRVAWVEQQVPPDAVFLCDEIDMLDHLQFASNLMLYDFRLFSAEELKGLVTDDRINSLAAGRKEYLRDHFLSRGQEGLTALRDQMIAAHKKAGHQVFVFSGPNDQWQSWAGLAQYGLKIKFLGEHRVPEPYLPVIAPHWKLQEIVPMNP